MADNEDSAPFFLANVATYIAMGGSLFFSLSVFYNYSFFDIIGNQYLSALTLLDHISINLSWLLPSVIFSFLVLWAILAIMCLLSPITLHKKIPVLSAGLRAGIGFIMTVVMGLLFHHCDKIAPYMSFSEFFLPYLFLALTVVFAIKTLENMIILQRPRKDSAVIDFIAKTLMQLVLLAYSLLFLSLVYEKGESDARTALNSKNAKSHVVFTDAFPCSDPQLNKDSHGKTTMTGVAILMNLERGVLVYRPAGGKSSLECDTSSIDKFNLVHFVPWDSVHDIISVTQSVGHSDS